MERATVQPPNMGKAKQITEHAYKAGRHAPVHIKPFKMACIDDNIDFYNFTI